MARNKPIMIDGVEFYKQTDINRGLDEEHYVTEFHLLATHYNLLLEEYARKTQECEKLKKYLNQIRDEELSHLDVEWDEYETSARQEDYSNIITLVERALGEIDD